VDPGPQFHAVDRLGQKIHGPGLEGPFQLATSSLTVTMMMGMSRSRRSALMSRVVDAVHVGHDHVHEDEVHGGLFLLVHSPSSMVKASPADLATEVPRSRPPKNGGQSRREESESSTIRMFMPLPVNLAPPQSSTRGDICVGARALERVGPARWQ